MLEITVEEFRNFKNKHNFIFFFSIGYCRGCDVYFEEIRRKNISHWYIKVNAQTEEELMEMDIEALPCTKLFDRDGACKWNKYGVLYDKQIKELMENFGK